MIVTSRGLSFASSINFGNVASLSTVYLYTERQHNHNEGECYMLVLYELFSELELLLEWDKSSKLEGFNKVLV